MQSKEYRRLQEANDRNTRDFLLRVGAVGVGLCAVYQFLIGYFR